MISFREGIKIRNVIYKYLCQNVNHRFRQIYTQFRKWLNVAICHHQPCVRVRRFESFSNLITIRVHRYRIIARRCPKSKAVRDCFHSFKSVTHDRSAVKPGERAALIFYLIHCCEIFAGIFVIPFVIPLSIRRTKLPTFFLF